MKNKRHWNTRPDYDRDDIIGEKFGYWRVLACEGPAKNRQICYLCQCVCGKFRIIRRYTLENGGSSSCGCQNRKEGTLERIYYKRYKRTAGNRGYAFNLSLIKFVEMVMCRNCFYCGCAPYKVFTNGGIYYKKNGIRCHGLDRINNNIGYSEKNCVTCCEQCNKAKRTLTMEEFKKWLERIYSHYIKGE